MRDIYEAAERQSATLAMFIEHLARRRGWSARTLSGMIMGPEVQPGVNRDGPRLMMIYGASVLLPYGRAASFIPARMPRVDGETWMIEVKRSDGVSRPQWNGGIAVQKRNGSYVLAFGSQVLDEAALASLLEALGTP